MLLTSWRGQVKRKTVSYFLFGLLSLMLGGLTVALYVIDWNQYRGTLASLASERLGVQVELAGNLRLAFLPRPAVSAELVRITPGRDGYNDAIATADRIDMSLGLAALLGGGFELQSLAFEGLSANLVETETGWSLEGWPTNNGAEENTGPTLLSLDRFRVNSGAIVVRPLSGHEVALEGLNLDLSGALPTGPLDWNGSAIVLGEPVTVSGRVMPTRTEGSTSAKASISLDGGLVDFSGRVSDSGEIQGRLRSNGQNLQSFIAFLQSVTGSAASAQLPALPFQLDMQVERDSRGVSRLVSRQAQLGETRGAIDLTLAENDTMLHIAGNASFGVVPLDVWLDAMEEQEVSEASPAASTGSVLSGGVDVSVETIEFRDKQIQQASVIVGLSGENPTIDQFSALLPGASRLSFRRDSAAGGGIRFQSGGLQEALNWAGIQLSDLIPAGRLRTADLRATLAVTDNAWIVSDLSGTVDTSGLNAEVSGKLSPFSTDAARVSLDTLNMDAYWPDPSFERSGDSAQSSVLPPFEFAVDIGKLHWLNQDFASVSAAGAISASGVSIQQFNTNQMDGRVHGSVDIAIDEGDVADASVSIDFANWRFPILSKLYPDAGSLVNLFTGNNPAAGQLVLDGPMSALQSRVSLSLAERSIELSGTLSNTPTWQGRLQGSVEHPDVGGILARARVWGEGINYQLPIRTNLTIEGDAAAVDFSATGDLAGAQISVTGNRTGERLTAEISVAASAGQSTGLDPVIQAYGYTSDTSEIRRLRSEVSVDDVGWSLAGLDIRNGTSSLTGDIQNQAGQLSGSLSLSNFTLSRISDIGTQGDGAYGDDGSGAINVGSLNLALDNVTGFGQSLSAPAARLAAEEGTLLFVAGDGASLNGNPFSARIGLEEASGLLQLDMNADTIDIGRFAASVGGAGGFSGQVQAELNLTATARGEEPFVSTLTGQGRFEGGAGSLYFMAVPELVRTIQSENSAASFLQGIGRLLRSGTTDFASLKGSFQVDNGVALVDEVLATGDWGHLELDGQLNILRDYVNMSGELALLQLQDAPVIPVTYEGALSNPNVNWTSRALERFAIAGIERRLRTSLFGELERAQAGQGEEAAPNPGAFVSGIATGLLNRLRERQEARRRAEEAAKANQETSETSSQ